MAEVTVSVWSDSDAAIVRQAVREMALSLGMSRYEAAEVETSASELATNLARHAGGGEIIISAVETDGRPGVRIVSSDTGPGIPDIELALGDGYSTARSMGAGLPGVRRLMDELSIESVPGVATVITAVKWKKN